MYLIVKRQNGGTVAIIAQKYTERRLQNTCFRGPERRLAGNFLRWRNLVQVLNDGIVLGQLMEAVENAILENERQNSLTVDYPEPVGWSSTDRLERYRPEDLEPFKLNKRSTALRLKADRTHLAAPSTSFLTIIFEASLHDKPPAVVIRSVYPGEDIGELDGDLTAREKCVFFDWSHPGE